VSKPKRRRTGLPPAPSCANVPASHAGTIGNRKAGLAAAAMSPDDRSGHETDLVILRCVPCRTADAEFGKMMEFEETGSKAQDRVDVFDRLIFIYRACPGRTVSWARSQTVFPKNLCDRRQHVVQHRGTLHRAWILLATLYDAMNKNVAKLLYAPRARFALGGLC
jgi:hypothetical protein